MVSFDVGDVERTLVGVNFAMNKLSHGVEAMGEGNIRVLRFIGRLNIGGPAVHTVTLTRSMQSLGYDTMLVTGIVGPEEGDMAYLAEAHGVKPVVIPRLSRSVRPLDDLLAFFRVLSLLFKFRPQIVHTHTAKAGTVGRLAAFVYNQVQKAKSKVQSWVRAIFRGMTAGEPCEVVKQKCNVVHTFHGHVLRGYFSPLKTRLILGVEKCLARITDIIVVVSEKQREELSNDFGIGRQDQYRVVRLGFDLTAFDQSHADKGEFLRSLGLGKNEISLVAIVGRLTPIKNHRMFLEAVQLLIETKTNTRTEFLVVGDGELRSAIESMAHKMHLEKRVTFTGWVKDLAPLYADLDILALTSDNEGTPVAVIEALASGVGVVATDVGGVRELIGDCGTRNAPLEAGSFAIGQHGMLVKSGDARGFANAIQYLLDHPSLCKEMGERGKRHTRVQHTEERLIADVDHLYRSVLEAS